MPSPMASFFMYEGPAFPSPESLLACRSLQRLAPLKEPMAQFYSELGLHRQLRSHPSRVYDAEKAELFYVPVLPHLDSDAGGCNGTRHKERMRAVATHLRSSPHWQRRNGTDHFYACTCVMMKGMLTNELWSLLSTAVHSVHSVPRGNASPSRCQLAIPYYNPTFASGEQALVWREPGRPRPTLAHFRGRVMNRVRAALVRTYGGAAGHVIEAAHPSTAARCNLNKCGEKALANARFPRQEEHLAEMTKSLFCLVPVGDSPPSSRLYLAVAAGCLPVIISDGFEGAFSDLVPWDTFSVRIREARVAGPGRARRGGAKRAAPVPVALPLNLTKHLLDIANDAPRLRQMQEALRVHAVDVLWEAPGSRVGSHTLGLATRAARDVCRPRTGAVASLASPVPPPPPPPGADPARQQIIFRPV